MYWYWYYPNIGICIGNISGICKNLLVFLTLINVMYFYYNLKRGGGGGGGGGGITTTLKSTFELILQNLFLQGLRYVYKGLESRR